MTNKSSRFSKLKLNSLLYCNCIVILSFILCSPDCYAQSIDKLRYELGELENSKGRVASTMVEIDKKIEQVKLNILSAELEEIGFPSNDHVIRHKAFSLAYGEEVEQAIWVMHIISSEIKDGTVGRTNDFRIDTLIQSGSAEEEDYFIKTRNSDGDVEYDGFGYDRGHLAPSADFRWSRSALSESYYYSNMSPQLPGFNREKWADLENYLRNYIVSNDESSLIVVTGPIFDGDTNYISRSKNKVAIPTRFFKVALDPKMRRAVGFILPHKEHLKYPIESYMMSVESVEKETGFTFFPNYPVDSVKNGYEPLHWSNSIQQGDVIPKSAPDLPKGHFNTIDAKNFMQDGSTVQVVGTVVSARKSRKGNALINLDRKYPNQIFTIFIKKEDLVNFPYDPVTYFDGKEIVVKGKVAKMGSTPTIYLESEKRISLFD